MSAKSELRIFDDIAPQIVTESAIFQDVHPTNALDSNTDTVEFLVQGSDTEYLDLNDTLLSVVLSVKKSDGTDIAAADKMQPVPSNYFMHALFSDITLSLNDTLIEGGDVMYSYKAAIESMFNFSEESKGLQLLPAGVTDEEDERKEWAENSRQFEVVGALRLDFLNQPKYIIPGVSVRIRMKKADSAFSLHLPTGTKDDGKTHFNILLKKCILYVRRVKVHPSVIDGHKSGLKKKNAIYPYTRTKTISYSIPSGSTSYLKENLFSTGRLPKFVIVGLVHNKAYTGSLDHEPFKFEPFKVNHVALHRDGQAIPYKAAYNPNFDSKLITDVYVRSILQNTQILNTNRSNGITMDIFKDKGYTFFTFNLTPDYDMTQVQEARNANLRLDMRFSEALKHAINVICYGIFDSKLEITETRQIIRDAHV